MEELTPVKERPKLASASKLTTRQLGRQMSECNKAGVFVFPEPITAETCCIVLIKGNKRIVGNGAYKMNQAKLKKGDLRYDKIIYDLYHTEFLKLGLGEKADESFNHLEVVFEYIE